MKIYFFAKCPYCGYGNKFVLEKDSQYDRVMKVYTCDVEEGGCDRPFVVDLELKPVVTTYMIDLQGIPEPEEVSGIEAD